MSVGMRTKLDPKKVSVLVQDAYLFMGKQNLSQEEFAYKVKVNITTIKVFLNRNNCTKRTAMMVCQVIGKQYSEYNFEEENTLYDYKYLRENLISYLQKKDIKPTTFAIINRIDKDIVVRFVNGLDDFLTADRIESICHGMGQSSSIYKIKDTSTKPSNKGAKNPYDVDKKKNQTTENQKQEPVDLLAIYQDISKTLYGILQETFEEFLKNNADKYIQKKKGFFK